MPPLHVAVEVLQPLSAAAEAQGVKLVCHAKQKSEDGSAQFKELVNAIQAAEDAKEHVLGHLPKDKHTGKFVDVYNSVMAESGMSMVDVASAFADLLAVKDAAEIMNHKKAAMLAARVVKDFVVGKIESIIDEGKSVKHSKLTEQTEQVVIEPAKVQVKLKPENCDIAYPPIFQSGGKYDLKVLPEWQEVWWGPCGGSEQLIGSLHCMPHAEAGCSAPHVQQSTCCPWRTLHAHHARTRTACLLALTLHSPTTKPHACCTP